MRRPRLPKDRRVTAALVVAVVLVAALGVGIGGRGNLWGVREVSLSEIMGRSSSHASTYDHVLVATGAPILAAAASPLGCWYDKAAGTSGLVPLLVDGDPEEAGQQARVVEALGLSMPLRVEGPDHTSATVSAALAAYERAAGAVVVDVGMGGYNASLVAGALASYLDVPVLVRDGESKTGEVRDALEELGATYVILAGPFGPSQKAVAKELGKPVLYLDGRDLRSALLAVIADRFGRVDYGVLTNPTDVLGVSCEDVQAGGPVEWEEQGRFSSLSRVGHVETLGAGSSSTTIEVPMEAGVQRLRVHALITNLDDPLRSIKEMAGIVPIVSLKLTDASGGLIAYGSSIGYREGEAVLDVVAMDASGDMSLRMSAFYGIKGRSNSATMGQGWDGVGWSRISADWAVEFTRTPLTTPLAPQLPGLSRLAPYLAAAHGGFVVADGELSYLSPEWARGAGSGTAAGPWYDGGQHEAVNARVDRDVEALRSAVAELGMVGGANGTPLLDGYLSGPAWLAILGDASSIPQRYEPKDPSWEEDVQYGLGWATDEPYRLDGSLSIGRPLSTTVSGTSTLVARTLFYEAVAEAHMAGLDYAESNDWGRNYMLLYGEGGGQTGGLFWQRPFADELTAAGFDPHQYGENLQNDRQTMEARGAYERSNYMEVMLHGNWYWYCPEMNGADEYSTSVKVLDVRDWAIGPSTFLSAACLMGRIDGVPADQNIGLSLVHAGANAFVGATRSTGSESGTRWMEWDLIHNDTSVGEALRLSMSVHPVAPTMYVRMLFADPAFNPYEPGNGYADQGRPRLLG